MKRQRIDIKKRIKKRIELQHQKYVFIEKHGVKAQSKQNKVMNERLTFKTSPINIPPKIQNIVVNKIVDETLKRESLKLNYDICVIITTYNRENLLLRLLDNINKNKFDYKILILVFDDASDKKYNLTERDVEYIRYEKNHGKIGYWKLITDTMLICKQINSKYFIYLPDDVTLNNNFFRKSIDLYESIQDINKVCLSLLMIKQQIGKSNWTGFKPISYSEDIYKTQWCDLCFISEKKIFEKLEYKIDEISQSRWNNKRFKINRNFLSSGVGANLSNRLYNCGYNMYHVKKTLVIHEDHESVMNYEIRKNEKLTT